MAKLYNGTEVVEHWSPLDDTAMPEFVPAQWTGPHVALRLADAWKILSRTPWKSPYPRGYGGVWPAYKIEWYDLMAIVGGGELESMQRQANRTKLLPTHKEISQMEQAIDWPMDYLSNERAVLVVHVCARMKSVDGDLDREIRRRNYGGEAEQWRRLNWTYCDTIADALIGKQIMVF